MNLLIIASLVLPSLMAARGIARAMRKRKWVIGIYEDKCIGCGRCAGGCRHKVLRITQETEGKRLAKVKDGKQCTACGHCIRQCPHNALTLVSRTKEAVTLLVMALVTTSAAMAQDFHGGTVAETDSTARHGITDDAVYDSLTLSSVTVKGRSMIVKNDRRLFIPAAGLRDSSTDGIDLLRRMHLPRISINALTGEIGVSGGGNVRLCINGVQATSAELAAVPVGNIIRIEYHDNPGARYGDAVAVIDYITRHADRGGSVSGDMLDTFGNGMAAINNLSARVNSGKSEWSLLLSQMQIKRSRWIRDYDETRVTPDGMIQRREVGEPVPINVENYSGQLNYSIADKDRYFFNARLNYTLDCTPQSEEADRKNILHTSQPAYPVSISEHMDERSCSPSLDLYMQRMLPGGGNVIVNAVGTYIGTRSTRTYQETSNDIPMTDVLSKIKGRKYSIIAEALIEKPFGTHKVTAGLRHTQAYTNNIYTGSASATVNMRQAESSAYAEYSRVQGKLSYMANITATRIYYSQGCEHTGRTVVQPSASIQFAPSAGSYIRYRINLRTKTPQLADMNDVEQIIDGQQIRCGNPGLKSFEVLEQALAAGCNGTWLCADLTLGYKYEHNPIMEQVTFKDGLFVRTTQNQRAFHTLSAEATVTLRPWKDVINISFTPSLNRYISHGYAYTHTHTMPRLRCDIDLTLGRWMVSYGTLTGYANYLYGERLMEENSMHLITVGYRWKTVSLQAGVLNPFMKQYRMETREMAELMPAVSCAYTDRPCQFAMKMTFSLSHGRQKEEKEKLLQHEDTENGIMQGVRGI